MFPMMCWALAALPTLAPKPPPSRDVEIAGVAEFLRSVPKRFATLQNVDPVSRRVTLLIEGETLAKVWELAPDAEIKVCGWWGRLDQFTIGDRVWAWFVTDRHKQPTGILMLADELSEQDIHGTAWSVSAHQGDRLTLHPSKGADRVLTCTVTVPSSHRVLFQSAGKKVRLLLTPSEFEQRRTAQKAASRADWTKHGLPGTVTFLHRLSGELEVMLDHEAQRWGRSLVPGDLVSLPGQPPIKAVVRKVQAWRERTLLRLVVAAADQGDLHIGQRLQLCMKPPAADVEEAQLPPDLDRPRSRAERVEWFLASIYCTCSVHGDVCTGHFYTLASCNPNGCAAPRLTRKKIGELIDQGLTDRQIFEVLLKERGPGLLRPHLMP